MVNGDFTAPPSAIKEAATSGEHGSADPDPERRQPVRGAEHAEPPFDDINVRKAVIANSNRTDLRNTRGGELIGPVATHYLPPDFPGFEEAGGLEGPDLDFIANPNGDPQLAAEYMKKAGFSSGKCEGADCEITMVGDDSPPGSDTADGREEPARGARLQGQLPEGDPRHHVHEVLQHAVERTATSVRTSAG